MRLSTTNAYATTMSLKIFTVLSICINAIYPSGKDGPSDPDPSVEFDADAVEFDEPAVKFAII